VLTGANKGRLAGQQGVAATSTIKTALTAAALGITAYARGWVGSWRGPVTSRSRGTTPTPTPPENVARAQRQLTALQWLIPVLTGRIRRIWHRLAGPACWSVRASITERTAEQAGRRAV
jgi:hypothetical protein